MFRSAFLNGSNLQCARHLSTAAQVRPKRKPIRSTLAVLFGFTAGAMLVYKTHNTLVPENNHAFLTLWRRAFPEDANLTEMERKILTPWQIAVITKFPTRMLSRAWGYTFTKVMPIGMRVQVYSMYARAFGCNLDDMAADDLREFESLQDFFGRALKPGVRPIADSPVVSPVDGTVLHYGPVTDGRMEQVKGITYSMKGLLGHGLKVTQEVEAGAVPSPGKSLQHIIIYLAPGDYHRYHSPVDWVIDTSRHFPGDLLSVNPAVARVIEGLFNYNERASLTGEWEHGFFSYVAVGAYNVGSMMFNFDPELTTNKRGPKARGSFIEKKYLDGVKAEKGEELGRFKLGSTIIMVFEAPEDFEFTVEAGQKLRLGEPLCKA